MSSSRSPRPRSSKTSCSRPRLRCLNIHSGRLPKYRGMGATFWQLLAGERGDDHGARDGSSPSTRAQSSAGRVSASGAGQSRSGHDGDEARRREADDRRSPAGPRRRVDRGAARQGRDASFFVSVGRRRRGIPRTRAPSRLAKGQAARGLQSLHASHGAAETRLGGLCAERIASLTAASTMLGEGSGSSGSIALAGSSPRRSPGRRSP